MKRAIVGFALLAFLAESEQSAVGFGGPKGAAPHASERLVLTRGDVTPRVLLTGELDAATSTTLVVPRTSEWTIQLRWLEADGTPVKAGQKVAEFDNAAFAADLNEKKLAALEAAGNLEKQRADNGIATADKAFDVEKAKGLMESARLSASVDEGSFPARVWHENQLDLERQKTAYEKAKDDLVSQTKSAALDLEVKQIALDKSRREIVTAEAAIAQLELHAPKDGIVVVAEHPREGRKLDVGDSIWVGLPVVRLPDMSKMVVKAWLSDEDEGRLTVGMEALCTLDAHADKPLRGVIRAISPVAREPSQKSQRRAFQVLIDVEGSGDERLLPGLSAKVEVNGRKVENALVAPRSTIDFDSKPTRLSLADGAPVEVEVGTCDSARCEVTALPGTKSSPLAEGLVLRAFGRGE